MCTNCWNNVLCCSLEQVTLEKDVLVSIILFHFFWIGTIKRGFKVGAHLFTSVILCIFVFYSLRVPKNNNSEQDVDKDWPQVS